MNRPSLKNISRQIQIVKWKHSVKEVGDITYEIEDNLCSMKIVQELCGSDWCKEISRGILGKQGDEVMRRIFDACWKSEGKFYGEER